MGRASAYVAPASWIVNEISIGAAATYGTDWRDAPQAARPAAAAAGVDGRWCFMVQQAIVAISSSQSQTNSCILYVLIHTCVRDGDPIEKEVSQSRYSSLSRLYDYEAAGRSGLPEPVLLHTLSGQKFYSGYSHRSNQDTQTQTKRKWNMLDPGVDGLKRLRLTPNYSTDESTRRSFSDGGGAAVFGSDCDAADLKKFRADTRGTPKLWAPRNRDGKRHRINHYNDCLFDVFEVI